MPKAVQGAVGVVRAAGSGGELDFASAKLVGTDRVSCCSGRLGVRQAASSGSTCRVRGGGQLLIEALSELCRTARVQLYGELGSSSTIARLCADDQQLNCRALYLGPLS